MKILFDTDQKICLIYSGSMSEVRDLIVGQYGEDFYLACRFQAVPDPEAAQIWRIPADITGPVSYTGADPFYSFETIEPAFE